MFGILRTIKELCSQRTVINVIALFISLVLFNTTYMSLGTIVPMLTIILGLLLFVSTRPKTNINNRNNLYIWMSFLFLFSTALSGGDEFTQCLKIILTALFSALSTKLCITVKEVRFLSLIICVSYVIYAILVIQSMSGETMYYGRAQIRILGSEYPLDPNVVSAVFVFPFIICLYNLLYGKYKIMALLLILLFFVAIVALGSRGGFLALAVSSAFLLGNFMFSKKSSMMMKIMISIVLIVVAVYVINFLSGVEGIFGLTRILDFETDDVSNGRTGVWIERMSLLLDSPLWGYGINYDMGIHKGMASHNTIIQILHYGGLIGFILFLTPLYNIYRRKTVSFPIKLALFSSVMLPIFFIDTIQERTLWNFVIFYSFLSAQTSADDCLLWNKKTSE